MLVFHFMIPGLPKSPARVKPLGEKLWVICVSYWVDVFWSRSGFGWLGAARAVAVIQKVKCSC